jgi:hypothetical protein
MEEKAMFRLCLISGFLFISSAVFAPAQGATDSQPVADPEYVNLVFFWLEMDMPPDADLSGLVRELKAEFGTQSPESNRHVAFCPGLTHALDLQPSVLKQRIVMALDVADETGIPVYFHLDDMHFWTSRSDMHNDPEAVEWSAFPAPGETHGPIVPRYWLNWGSWAVYPAPIPCFESERFRADVAHRLGECIGAPIAERLKQWKAKSKEYLFAGIGIGNETELPGYRDVGETSLTGLPPRGVIWGSNPPENVTMRADEMVTVGYNALHKRGFNAKSIEEMAKQKGISVLEMTDALLYEVARDYSAFRAKTLVDAGIPRERIYTHFLSPLRAPREKGAKARERSGEATIPMMLPPPVEYSVNPYSRPGFTLVRSTMDVKDIVARIDAARQPGDKDRSWAGVETYPTIDQGGRPQTQEEYESYLGVLFSNGVKVVNLYVWSMEPFAKGSPFVVKENPGVKAAIHSWLSRKELPTTLTQSPQAPEARKEGPPLSLQRKVGELKKRVLQWQKEGRDLTPIQDIMRTFEGTVALNGDFVGAEKILDKAIEALGADPKESR